MHSGVIAIVGRPNVGKSTIFNRIAGSRVSIVEDFPGVTRDRIYTTGEWSGKKFQLIDTGGIQLADQPYQEEIRAQVQIAMNEADVILFVVNGKMGMTDDDSYIAGILQKQTKPVVLKCSPDSFLGLSYLGRGKSYHSKRRQTITDICLNLDLTYFHSVDRC